MSISSKATGLRPGVCTSTTRPTSPYTGMVIYETDTGYLRVWDGSAWDYLSQSQNTAEGFPVETYMGLVKVIPTSATNGTVAANGTVTVGNAVSTCTVNGAFSSLYDSYRIVVRGIVPTATDSFMIMMGSGATTNHFSSMYYDLYTGGSTGVVRTSNTGKIYCALNEATNTNSSFAIDVHNPYLSVATQVHGTWQGRAYQGWCGGFQNQNTSFTSFTIATDGAGTMTGGTIRVYGYRN